MNQNKKYTKWVALSMVMANMIGVGVFTSLGFQVTPESIPDAFSIIVIWALGGLIALCGAFVYTEVATTLKESGGEYLFLSRLYHPVLGFMSGWISLIFGFAGAIAGSAIAIGKYSAPILNIDPRYGTEIFGTWVHDYKLVSLAAIILLSAVHMIGVRTGGMVQNILTAIKIGLIIVFCSAPFFVSGFEPSSTSFGPSEDSWDIILSLPFAGALAWVLYAYSGWNASAYIAGNVENPRKSLPFSLIGGTLLVTIIYVILNIMFMYSAEFEELAYKEEIGNIVAINLFGEDIGILFSGIFSIALISTLSAMVIAGPRVTEQIGKDYSVFKKLTVKSKGGTPTIAIIVQGILAILLMFFLSFEQLIQTIIIALSCYSLLTVIGVFLIRRRVKLNREGDEIVEGHKSAVRTWGYPVTPIIFIAATLWMIGYFAWMDYEQLIIALLVMVPGVVIYYLVDRKK